jgi:hypothetical protein
LPFAYITPRIDWASAYPWSAAFWYQYKKSADQGYAKAQSNLGIAYTIGKGVLKDYKQAVYWYQKAADQGYAYFHNSKVFHVFLAFESPPS